MREEKGLMKGRKVSEREKGGEREERGVVNEGGKRFERRREEFY